jgi:tight adherence protein C
MSAPLVGVGLGLLFAAGLTLAVLFAPPMRPVRLDQRLAPYLRGAPRPSRLLLAGTDQQSTVFTAVRRLLRPVLADAVRVVDRLAGGRGSVRRRLAALGSTRSVEDFRVEQVVWGALGLGCGVAATVLAAAIFGGVNLVSAAACCVGGLVAGVLGRDWWLGRQLRRRCQAMLAEFPVVAELLALAVTAGEGATGAIARVSRLAAGELSRDLSAAMARARAGAPLVRALEELRDSTSLDHLARFVDGIIVAVERGTPLAEVLRAQAADVREAGKRALLEAGGRREIAMMLPVVFLIMPVTVLFALFPGLVSITQLVR